MPENGQHPVAVDGHQVAAAVELNQQTRLLTALLSQQRAGPLEIAVGDFSQRELVMDSFPVAGSRRALVFRSGAGTDNVPVPAAPAGVLVLPENAGRLGGAIVNSGAAPVILYLTVNAAPTPGAPAIWLAASGGSWDFRLGNVLWSGNVSAAGQGGVSALTVAEV